MNNTKSGHKTPRLNPIPANTVVHTPTEAEAKELLAILHENGWKWFEFCGKEDDTTYWDRYEHKTCYNLKQGKIIDFEEYIFYADEGYTILTLADFKRLYCEQEKPQPKFKPRDKVNISVPTSEFLSKYNGAITCVLERQMRGDGVEGWLTELSTAYVFKDEWLEPYTEPETKPTEDMETKGKHNLSQNPAEKCDNNDAISTDEKKELNLCELLQGREGESIFLTTMGEVLVEKVSEEHLFFRLRATEPGWRLNTNGKMSENGVVITYPSRALYEQYPLDPYAAWMKWQEEQKKHWVSVGVWVDDSDVESDMVIDTPKIYFRTPADRDKCLEEIKAIINKYSK